jgi:cell division transport system permease protein
MLAFREAFIATRRAPLLSILGVLTIAFSLFAFGLFSLVALNIKHSLQQVEERVEIRGFIADGTAIEPISLAMKDIATYPEVAKVEYVSQEQALARARKELPEFQDVFEANVLPASLEVHLRSGLRSPAVVKGVADRIGRYDFVDDVRYGEEWVDKLYRLRNIATAAGTALGLAFALVAVIIIGATIRMAVLHRAKEIAIMKYVGATDGFIRMPFLIDGLMRGVLGGVIAVLMLWFANRAISRAFIQTVFFDPRTIAIGILGGALIGILGSVYAVGRHLRRI